MVAPAIPARQEALARALYESRPAWWLHPEERAIPWDEALTECADRVARCRLDAGLALEFAPVAHGLELIDTLAAMTTDDEMAPDGMSGDDAASTLSRMIEDARAHSPRRPDVVNTGDESR